MAERHVYLERVYDEVRARGRRGGGQEPPPGTRFLVDRLWPRGVSKASLEGVQWVKEAAPSSDLRTWFGHDPARFREFADRYRAELDSRPEALSPILDAARRGPVTLLYAAKDSVHNHALVLRDHLEEALPPGSRSN